VRRREGNPAGGGAVSGVKRKVRYEELLPHEMEEIMAEAPIAYLPFGILEWHGPHLALGNDAVKAHEICLRVAEKAGGVVVPPTFWAVGGMPHPWTTKIDGDLVERLFYAIFEQMAHVGFRVVIAVTGHYGLEQCLTLKRAARGFMQRSGLIVFPAPEYEVACDRGYRGDHAAKWETSILWALRPELVDMSRLSRDLTRPLSAFRDGIAGEDPRVHASRELGEEIVAVMVDRLAEVAGRLLGIAPLDRSKFLEVLGKQVRFLEARAELRRRGREIALENYWRFLDLFWRGKYAEANEAVDAVLSEALREARGSPP